MCSTGSRSWFPPFFASFLLLFFASPPAAADTFDDARRVFGEGQALYADKDYGGAAEKYEEAYRLMRSPLLLFNIAQARRLQFQRDGDHRNLISAKKNYERFLTDADPNPSERTRAENNLTEVNTVAEQEARQQFAAAEKAMKLSKFDKAIDGYAATYDLTGNAAVLFNLAQAERKQYQIDNELDRLARAEEQLKTFRREAPGKVAPETIDAILTEIREQRAEYHRKRESEARSKEPAAMAEARRLYSTGDATGALAALTAAEGTAGNPRIVLLQLYRLRGQAAVLAGQEEQAVDAFKRYLAIEPAADGTGLRDEARTAFDRAREFWKSKTPLKLDHLAPGKVPPGKPVTIPVKIASDPLGMIVKRELRFRKKGAKKWDTIPLARAKAQAKLPVMGPPLVGKEYPMEYYIVALDSNGGVLDTIGTPSAPLGFLVTEDAIIRPPPIYKRWWFWAATGAVVAGTVATIAIVTNDGLPDGEISGDVSALHMR